MVYFSGQLLFVQKIADVFNDLTQNQLNKSKLVPPSNDSDYLVSANEGKVYSKYNWRYDDDSVSNGGKFYDDIEAADDDFEDHSAL